MCFSENHGMSSFQAAGYQPVRQQIPTNVIEKNIEPMDPEDMEDYDNADEVGETGGIRARTTAQEALDTGIRGAYD